MDYGCFFGVDSYLDTSHFLQNYSSRCCLWLQYIFVTRRKPADRVRCPKTELDRILQRLDTSAIAQIHQAILSLIIRKEQPRRVESRQHRSMRRQGGRNGGCGRIRRWLPSKLYRKTSGLATAHTASSAHHHANTAGPF